jgi:Arc-like DNA binding domain
MAKKSQELRPVMVRLPERLRRRVEARAKKNQRSMNTEIINRLTRSIEEDEYLEQREADEGFDRAVSLVEGAGFKVVRPDGTEGTTPPADPVELRLTRILEKLDRLLTEKGKFK